MGRHARPAVPGPARRDGPADHQPRRARPASRRRSIPGCWSPASCSASATTRPTQAVVVTMTRALSTDGGTPRRDPPLRGQRAGRRRRRQRRRRRSTAPPTRSRRSRRAGSAASEPSGEALATPARTRPCDRPGAATIRSSSARISAARFGSNRRQRPSGGTSRAAVCGLSLSAARIMSARKR